MKTKDRIIEEALNLFSVKGYNAVSVEEIAFSVGIKAPSLYKHYKSKQCIFDAIIEKMQENYQQQMSRLQLNGMNPNLDQTFFENITEIQLIEIGRILFSFFFT